MVEIGPGGSECQIGIWNDTPVKNISDRQLKACNFEKISNFDLWAGQKELHRVLDSNQINSIFKTNTPWQIGNQFQIKK